jgi:osmoprotectant transport system permease protein
MITTDLVAHIRDHLALASLSLSLALIVTASAGALVGRVAALRSFLLSASNAGRVIPSLALLALMLPFLGVGFLPSTVALTILAIPPIAINADLGLRSVPLEIIDAARGLGMTQRQIRMRVQWPLALPVFFVGVRLATVEVIGAATLAAFIGGGGLGEYIINGLANNDMPTLMTGAATISFLALSAQVLLGMIERRLASRTRDSRSVTESGLQ